MPWRTDRVWRELKDSFQGGGSRKMKIDNFALLPCFLLSNNTQRQDQASLFEHETNGIIADSK